MFDLIVGTSAGGIVALGLGAENWPVDVCAEQFERFCPSAFTLRRFGDVPLIGQLLTYSKSSKYATEPLEEALQSLFADELLFGGRRSMRRGSQCKVAVITATPSMPVVVSNYNRLPPSDEFCRGYRFQRAERPGEELKTWEAARATSAAPYYFQPFRHAPSNRVLIDGAIHHNNPIVIAESERRNIWPDHPDHEPLQPDVVVSIGSGVSAQRLAEATPGTILTPGKKRFSSGISNKISRIQHWKQVVSSCIESSTNPTIAWNTYKQAIELTQRHRYRRLNCELDQDPPKMDDVDSLALMKQFARTKAEEYIFRLGVQETAEALVATAFFFEASSKPSHLAHGGYEVPGSIFCRFKPRSKEMRALGRYLYGRRSSRGVMPYFVIQEVREEQQSREVRANLC